MYFVSVYVKLCYVYECLCIMSASVFSLYHVSVYVNQNFECLNNFETYQTQNYTIYIVLLFQYKHQALSASASLRHIKRRNLYLDI